MKQKTKKLKNKKTTKKPKNPKSQIKNNAKTSYTDTLLFITFMQLLNF